MTTDQIETLANRRNLATPDFDIKSELRYNVIPHFLDEVGHTRWRRRTATVTTVIGTQDYDLPADFFFMRRISPGANYPEPISQLEYVGENPERLTAAEQGTSNGNPGEYQIVPDSDGNLKKLRLYPTPGIVTTFTYVYTNFVPFKNAEEDIDLGGYIPEQYHYGLVSGLRAEIYLDRYGEGDPRYPAELNKYADWIRKARKGLSHEPATRNYGVYAR